MESMPIIAMTANALAEDKVACLAAGMNDHVGKPIDLDILVMTILKHCRHEIGDASLVEAASASAKGTTQDFRDAFTKVDAIVTPTSPVPAFKLGERTNDPLQMYLADIYTVTGSLAGVPGISWEGKSSNPGTRTTPRSSSFSDPPPSSMTLSGLMSRWMTPARCSAAAPLASPIAILRPSSRPSNGRRESLVSSNSP